MTILAALAFSLAAFAALALSMQRHHRDMFGKTPPGSRALLLRSAGWLLLAVSLLSALAGRTLLVGIVLWLGLAMVAALAVAMALTYRPSKRA